MFGCNHFVTKSMYPPDLDGIEDLAEVARSKLGFDVVGHYARPDVFRLMVKEEPYCRRKREK